MEGGGWKEELINRNPCNSQILSIGPLDTIPVDFREKPQLRNASYSNWLCSDQQKAAGSCHSQECQEVKKKGATGAEALDH